VCRILFISEPPLFQILSGLRPSKLFHLTFDFKIREHRVDGTVRCRKRYWNNVALKDNVAVKDNVAIEDNVAIKDNVAVKDCDGAL